MATQSDSGKPGRQPIPPAKRQRLQRAFEHASKMAATGNFDYATDLFTQCLRDDPGNLIYVQNFLGNLRKKYNNNKKGSKLAVFKGVGSSVSIKKASVQKDWDSVLATGLELLKLNPWDTPTLSAMAAACHALEFDECELAYLRGALEANIKDPDVNRQCAKALARQGQFDQAIVCWNRVLDANKDDEEAKRAVADLTVEKTIHKGGYETAKSSTEVMTDKAAQAERLGQAGPQITPERQLEKAIQKNPAELSNYLQLSDLHFQKERFDEAVALMSKALEVSGGDVNIRERLEDLQLRRQRDRLAVAERQAQQTKTPEALELYKQLRVELNNAEIEVFHARAERYPTNDVYKYELAVRLKRAGRHKDAITYFQQAGNDPQRKGQVLLSLGECFQQIQPPQYKLAMSKYEAAVQEISDRDTDLKKRALYLAGALAMGLKDLDKAERYLTDLAGLDFGYRDVSDRLDKIAQLRHKD